MNVLRVFFLKVSLNLLDLVSERSVGLQQVCHCVDTMNQTFGLCFGFLMKIPYRLSQRIPSDGTSLIDVCLFYNLRQSSRSSRCLGILPPLCLGIGKDVILLYKLSNFARQLLQLLIFFLLQYTQILYVLVCLP